MKINDMEMLSGDIFMIDSNKQGPKIVKFFQTAPTWAHHIWRKFFGKQEKVLYYHVGIWARGINKVYYAIEQQAKVKVRDATYTKKLLESSNRLLIVRRKDINEAQRDRIVAEAMEDIGKGYDILNCFGKFLTWLTGIPLFAMYLEWPDKEICINRVAQWYRNAIGEKFGVFVHSSLTTHTMYKYIKAHPEKFEIVYEGVPNEM